MPRVARYRVVEGKGGGQRVASGYQERARAELKRGVLQLAVLALLRAPSYGYDLLRVLAEAGITTEEGTLYPALRRLEKEQLLVAEWNTTGTRPRKYYRTTDRGQDVLASLAAEWQGVTRALESVLARPMVGGESDADDVGQPGSS